MLLLRAPHQMVLNSPNNVYRRKPPFCRSHDSPIFSLKVWRPACTVFGPVNFRVTYFPPITAAHARSCSRAFLLPRASYLLERRWKEPKGDWERLVWRWSRRRDRLRRPVAVWHAGRTLWCVESVDTLHRRYTQHY